MTMFYGKKDLEYLRRKELERRKEKYGRFGVSEAEGYSVYAVPKDPYALTAGTAQPLEN